MAVLAARSRDALPLLAPMDLRLHLHVEALLRGGEEEMAREDLATFGERIGENHRFRIAYLRRGPRRSY